MFASDLLTQLGRAHRRTWRTLAEPGRWVLVWRLLPSVLLLALAAVNAVDRPFVAVLGLIVAVTLPCRFAWPSTVLLVVVAAGLGASFAHADGWRGGLDVALVLSAYAAGRWAPSARRSFVAGGVALVGSLLKLLVPPIDPDPVNVGLFVVYVCLCVLLPAAIGTINGERARLVAALRERNLLLERAQQLGDLRARMRERARITGEMHDLIGHRLSLISLHAGALEMRTRGQSPEVSEQAELLRTTSRTALEELRVVLGILRLDGGAPQDGTEAIGTRSDVAALVAESRDAGLPIALAWSGGDLGDVDITVRRAVHRIVRESLTNVHKHAPGAPARLSVAADEQRIVIELRNARRHPAVSAGGTGLGLVGLRERARLAGGTYAAGVDNATGDFVVRAELPRRPPGAPATDPAVGLQEAAELETVGAGVAGILTGAVPSPGRGSMSKATKAAFGILAAFGALVVGASGYGVYYALRISDNTVSAATYQQVDNGDSRERVRRLTGSSSSLAQQDAAEREPPVPPGSSCDYVYETGLDYVYRFCYLNGALVRKDEIDVRTGRN